MDTSKSMIRSLLGLCLLLASSATLACSCIQFSMAQAVRSSDNVFVGAVRSEQVKGRMNLAELEVLSVVKGRGLSHVETSTNTAACGFGSLGVGENYLFFTDDKGSFGLCSGTMRLSPESEADVLQQAQEAAAAEALEAKASVLQYTQSIAQTVHHRIHARERKRTGPICRSGLNPE